MAMQMYFVSYKSGFTQQTSHSIQQLVHDRGGFILMVTRTGQVIALDDAEAPKIGAHPEVKCIGGVTLNPHGAAAQRLQQIFADNLAKQVDLSKLAR